MKSFSKFITPFNFHQIRKTSQKNHIQKIVNVLSQVHICLSQILLFYVPITDAFWELVFSWEVLIAWLDNHSQTWALNHFLAIWSSIWLSLDLTTQQDLIIACQSISFFAMGLARHSYVSILLPWNEGTKSKYHYHPSASKWEYLKKCETSVRQKQKCSLFLYRIHGRKVEVEQK
jgi:hypothetical protein